MTEAERIRLLFDCRMLMSVLSEDGYRELECTIASLDLEGVFQLA